MVRYIAVRFATMVLVLVVISVALFSLSRAAPGGPLASLVPPEMVADSGPLIAAKMKEYGLDQPLPVQYWQWVSHVAIGDLGNSFQYGRPVVSLMAERMVPTLELMGLGLFLGNVAALVLGVLQASRKGSVVDYGIGTLSLVLMSTPAFFLAMTAIYVFSARLQLLPSAQMSTPGDGSTGDLLRHLVLPVAVLAVVQCAMMTRYVRVGLLEEISRDYVRTALAQGATQFQSRMKALRNTLGPLVTVIMLSAPTLLGGAVVLESVFSWPGMGSLVLAAIDYRDYPIILGFGMAVAVLVVISNFIADILVSLLDPRVRLL
ncbi:ABC transporter permease [Arthrobacter sp. KBS0702]|uniref:ABC transporter permease n=1 Tax=Arthrobacter sp. KBS0702 TaxID=2578107 RepID=UPI00110F3AE7|nr:ABC transporter permease [Arthrobacter sp. KBS0702]QDW30633.1 ABC transporter permease [Arthrobacter sp. KBS0702]